MTDIMLGGRPRSRRRQRPLPLLGGLLLLFSVGFMVTLNLALTYSPAWWAAAIPSVIMMMIMARLMAASLRQMGAPPLELPKGE